MAGKTLPQIPPSSATGQALNYLHNEWDQLISDWTSRVGEVSKDLECREDEDLVEMEKGKKFCKKYIRHANVNVPIKKEEEDDDEIDAAKNENDREEL